LFYLVEMHVVVTYPVISFLLDKEVGSDWSRVGSDDKHDRHGGHDLARTKSRKRTFVHWHRIIVFHFYTKARFFTGEPRYYPIPIVLLSGNVFPLVTFRDAVNRYAPVGMVISNRAPFPGSPVSTMEIPVIARISRMRNRP